MKSLLRSGPVSSLLGLVIWCWMVLVARTTRWTIEGHEKARELWSGPDGLVFAAWHEQVFLLPSGWSQNLRGWPERPGGVAMLISLSPDGEPVAKAIEHLGITSIRGSKGNARKRDKDKGGTRALAEAIRLLKNSGTLCITPDGPRGPALEISPGALLLAQRAGATLVPYALKVASARRMKTWDRLIVPLPFGKGAIVYGRPLVADRSISIDQLQTQFQERLDEANQRAEELVDPEGVPSGQLKDAA